MAPCTCAARSANSRPIARASICSSHCPGRKSCGACGRNWQRSVPETYRPLLIEGLQQARDTRVPLVSIHRRFKVLIEDELDGLSPKTLRLVAHPGSDRTIASSVSRGADERVLLAVGPEGGWNAFELELVERYGFSRIRMGPRTLRSDTACIALLTLVHHYVADAC